MIYNSNFPLIYIHVPKCAGTSVAKQFKIWFGLKLYFSYFNENKGKKPNRVRLYKLLSKSYRSNLCIYGHFNSNRGFGVKDIYPELNQYVSILRNPTDVIISNFYYLQKTSTNWKDKSRVPSSNLSIYEYAKSCELNYLNHFPPGITLDNFKEFIQSNFLFIGIAEELEISLNILSQIIGKKKPDKIDTLNVTKRDDSIDVVEINDILRKRFILEYLVYDYVKESLNTYDS